MQRIVIFGASVSAQARNHASGEITGYSDVLRVERAAELGGVEFTRIDSSEKPFVRWRSDQA